MERPGSSEQTAERGRADGLEAGAWEARFESVEVIRRLGSFHLYAARQDGHPCVVAVSAPHVDPEAAAQRVRRARDAHASLAHRAVPPILSEGRIGDAVYLVFDTPARHDLARVLAGPAQPERPQAGGIAALIDLLFEVLLAYPPSQVIHRLSLANLLVDDRGRLVFLALGSDLLSQQGPALPAVSIPPHAPRVRLAREAVRLILQHLGPGPWWPAVGRAELSEGATNLDRFRSLVLRGWLHDGIALDPEGIERWLRRAVEGMPSALHEGEWVADRYRIERRLGLSPTGTLYLARDAQLGDEPVVLRGLLADDPRAARLNREARILRRLRHPNVVGGFDFVPRPDGQWVVMAYVPGESLAERLEQRASPLELAYALMGVADALATLAAQGVVHRHVTPDSILFDPDRGAVLADFGLARDVDPKAADAQITATGEVVGTFRYLAPELALGCGELTPAADIYSFGTVLLEVFLGRASPMHPPPESALRLLGRTAAPPALAHLIAACLAPEAGDRPRAEELRAVLGGEQISRLQISRDGLEIRLDGVTVPVGRRRAHPRILVALAERRAQGDPTPLSVPEVFAAGWPGDKPPEESALRNRVYVALNTLRELGLVGVIETVSGGYRIKGAVNVDWLSSPL